MSAMQNLSNLKYADLRKLAKEAGIKANMKSEKLIKALEDHFNNETMPTEPENTRKFEDSSSGTDSSVDEVHVPVIKSMGTAEESPASSDSPKQENIKPSKKRGRKAGRGQKTGRTQKKVVHVEREKRKLSESESDEKTHSVEKESSSNEIQPTKRRRRTFELSPSTKPAEHEIELNTSEVVFSPKTGKTELFSSASSSPAEDDAKDDSVCDIMEVMQPEMSSSDMKESLLAAIDKKVEEKLNEKTNPKQSSTVSQIPRFAAFLAKKKAEKAEKAAVTPGNKNWTKIHEKEFAKMDSIDVYLAKKEKRNRSFSNCIKQAKEAVNRTREVIDKVRNSNTQGAIKRRLPMPFRSPLGEKVTPFQPSVISTKNAKFNFGNAAKKSVLSDFTAGMTKPKTAPVSQKTTVVRRSPRNAENTSVTLSGDNRMSSAQQKTVCNRKSLSNLNNTVLAERRKSCVTPFKSLNLTVDAQSTKKVFDLQASLSKPLSWKPYTGKLKPLEVKKSRPVDPNQRNTNIKAAPQKNRRAQRLADMKGRQANNKFNEQMKRRGIVN